MKRPEKALGACVVLAVFTLFFNPVISSAYVAAGLVIYGLARSE